MVHDVHLVQEDLTDLNMSLFLIVHSCNVFISGSCILNIQILFLIKSWCCSSVQFSCLILCYEVLDSLEGKRKENLESYNCLGVNLSN